MLFAAALLAVASAETIVRTITLSGNEPVNLAQILANNLPKHCTKDGHTFAEGEYFAVGHLRYKCGKYGVYTIDGCRTEEGVDLNAGERKVIDNVLAQCFEKDGAIYFRTTVCDQLNEPSCAELRPDTPIIGTKGSIEAARSAVKTISVPDVPVVHTTRKEIKIIGQGVPPAIKLSQGTMAPITSSVPSGWHLVKEQTVTKPGKQDSVPTFSTQEEVEAYLATLSPPTSSGSVEATAAPVEVIKVKALPAPAPSLSTGGWRFIEAPSEPVPALQTQSVPTFRSQEDVEKYLASLSQPAAATLPPTTVKFAPAPLSSSFSAKSGGWRFVESKPQESASSFKNVMFVPFFG